MFLCQSDVICVSWLACSYVNFSAFVMLLKANRPLYLSDWLVHMSCVLFTCWQCQQQNLVNLRPPCYLCEVCCLPVDSARSRTSSTFAHLATYMKCVVYLLAVPAAEPRQPSPTLLPVWSVLFTCWQCQQQNLVNLCAPCYLCEVFCLPVDSARRRTSSTFTHLATWSTWRSVCSF